MKLIGIEVRVGHNGPYRKAMEAKVVPLEVVFAQARDDRYNHIAPFAEVTLHTTDGDVTVTAQLPFGKAAHIVENAEECNEFLRSQLEGAHAAT